jgi:DNA-binding transcriptional LysR family regulator
MDPKLLPDILIFLQVARAGSISKAARRLHTVQTNVSARIQKLESELGRQLLTRTARGIHLTAAGETLLPVAERLAQMIDQLSQAFPQSANQRSRLLRVGSLETFAATHLAALIAEIQEAIAGVEFTITVGSSRSLMRMLRDNELDVAFISNFGSSEKFRTELTLQEELVLLAPQDRTFSLNPKHWRAVSDLPFIVQRQQCSYSEKFLSYARKQKLQIQRIVEAGSIETLLGLVERGLGIAIVPRSLLTGSERAIKTVPLTPLGDERWVSIHLVENRARANATARSFVDHCRKRFSRPQSATSSAANRA